MTASHPTPDAAGALIDGAAWTPRRVERDLGDAWLGGVASGLARHLGVPLLAVRAAFVAATALGGLGVALYAGWWLMVPVAAAPEEAPGLESARRSGRRPGRIAGWGDAGPALALASLGVGVLLVLQALVGRAAVFWPLALGAVGVALVWRQADEAQRQRWDDTTARLRPGRVILGRGGPAAVVRVVAGLVLVAGALVAVVLSGGVGRIGGPVAAVVLSLAGMAVVLGPWLYRLAADLGAEREQRVRSQERADVAAHLHDSVLQTLALIQRNADDPGAVTRLARSQERDLRSWLYAGEVADDTTVARALRRAVAEIEDAHGIGIDLVTVGDRPLGEALRPIVAAAREALVNAAKHADVDRVDVYLEVGPAQIELFVRDRGRGFDPDAVGPDRLGLRSSIIDRMERHGGTAEIVTAPGAGTEVRLRLPVPGAPGIPGTEEESR
ncbi:ATP-binding protein [Nocardioides fonticola]|uniref:ATP-binding protein n=1 Tax=Nocardioides fonticola TaxID=450363 RepID=A0ABP7XAL6_9ACTN